MAPNPESSTTTVVTPDNHHHHSSKTKNKKRHLSASPDLDMSFRSFKGPAPLPPEVEEGKIEYKLKLVDPSSTRIEHLITQMKWRLQEGGGEAIYEIGVADCGNYVGLSKGELHASKRTLKYMADRLGATLTILREVTVSNGKTAAEILVRKVPDDQEFLDLRIAVLGNADCGKSTLIGVMAHGELDNGRGKARLNLFRHTHEIKSGRTSSISQEMVGFDSDGQIQNYTENNTVEDICENSTKIIHFIDVPGHQKYLKTTIYGLTGHSPHFAMIVVSANTGLAGTTREQLGYALLLQVPIFVVVTKTDACKKSTLEKTLTQLTHILKSPGCSKIPTDVNDEYDAVNAATQMKDDNVVPIFKVSSKTGEGLDILEKFLNMLPASACTKKLENDSNLDTLVLIDDVYNDVPDVGLVTGGIVNRGCVKEDDILLLGPSDTGSFSKVKVTSVHRNRVPCRIAKAGHAAALALVSADGDGVMPAVRKGMVLMTSKCSPMACYKLEADINLLFHEKSISQGFQCTLHIGTVCQTATIEDMSKEKLKTNDKATVTFSFKKPEYIVEGSKILFRQGTTRGVGTVTKVIPMDHKAEC